MRRLLLIGVTVTGMLPGLLPVSAPAQMAVFDANAILQLKTQLQQMKQMYDALSHPTGIANMVPGLNNPSLQNLLPGTQELQQDVSGQGNGGALSGQAQQFLNQNRIYTPQGNDFQALQMNQAAQSSANVQALASNANSSLQQHLADLDQLERDCVDTGQDVTQLTACNARLQAEQDKISAQQAQLTSLEIAAHQQEQVQQQQQEQDRRRSIEQYYQNTDPGNTGAAPTTGGASQCAFCG